jgi:hypothetical protein
MPHKQAGPQAADNDGGPKELGTKRSPSAAADDDTQASNAIEFIGKERRCHAAAWP